MEAWKEELYHYGMPERSGRYPWGSGERPYQRDSLKKNFGKTFERVNNGTYRKRKKRVDKALSRTQKQGKDKPNVSPAERTLKDVNRIVDDSGNVARKISNIKSSKKERQLRSEFQDEANKMSNNELRQVIERMNLEDTYVNKKTSRYSNGKSKALEVLDIAGDFASMGLSVAAIVATIYGLKK